MPACSSIPTILKTVKTCLRMLKEAKDEMIKIVGKTPCTSITYENDHSVPPWWKHQQYTKVIPICMKGCLMKTSSDK